MRDIKKKFQQIQERLAHNMPEQVVIYGETYHTAELEKQFDISKKSTDKLNIIEEIKDQDYADMEQTQYPGDTEES